VPKHDQAFSLNHILDPDHRAMVNSADTILNSWVFWAWGPGGWAAPSGQETARCAPERTLRPRVTRFARDNAVCRHPPYASPPAKTLANRAMPRT